MTLFSSQPGDEGLPGPARARVMAAIMTTTLMGVFDGTMINIALPSMAQEMRVPASIAVWFANGYLLAAAMTLAIFAALAARLGYRPVFLAGLTTFTLTSLGCALANTSEVLIGMRVLQGIGGAATLSIAPAILRSIFPGRLLGRILGLHALLIASSSAIGPVLGGTILHTLSWQWLFAINVVPGTLALLLAVKALPRDAVRKQAPFDTPGAILSALLLGSTIMAANSLQDYHPGSLCWTMLAALSGMAFIWQIRRADNPLLPPMMFKNERFTLAAFTSMIAFVSQGITFIALPFLFQSEYGYSPVLSALLFTPWPLGIVLIAPHAGRWADTISAPAISTLGLMIFGFASAPRESPQPQEKAGRHLLCAERGRYPRGDVCAEKAGQGGICHQRESRKRAFFLHHGGGKSAVHEVPGGAGGLPDQHSCGKRHSGCINWRDRAVTPRDLLPV